MASTLLSRLRCVTTTPLGEPVEPEVYCSIAVVSGSMAGATHSSADAAISSTAHHCMAGPSAMPSIALWNCARVSAVVTVKRASVSCTIDATRPITRVRAGGCTGTGTTPA